MADLKTYTREIEIALAAVREAGLLCRKVQAEIAPGTLKKADRSPVTVADYGSQALVCHALGDAFPDDPIIAEEDSTALTEPQNITLLEKVISHVKDLHPGADADTVSNWIDRGNATEYTDRFWTLDPIDGTKGFLRGGQYAVALALIVGGELHVAALCCPNLGTSLTGGRGTGTVYTAIRGQGTIQHSMTEVSGSHPVEVGPESDPALVRFCESVEAAHSSHDDATRIADKLGITAASVRLDSQTKYAVVSRGEAEAYLRLPKDETYVEKIWDHAAGALVVTEAGGRVTDIRGRDLDFSLGPLLHRNRGVVVSNGVLHEKIIQAIRELGIE